MKKRDRLKKFYTNRIKPNKRIVFRVLHIGALYILSGPTVAYAINMTEFNELAEGYLRISDSCFGGRRFGVPVPKSYYEGTVCVAILLSCGAAYYQGCLNAPLNGACIALIRSLSEKTSS